jgi:aldose sugar dehydrogenase
MRPRPPAVLVLATLLAGCTVEAAGDPPVSSTPAGAPLRVEVVADGLDHAWDVAQAPDAPCWSTSGPAG